MQYQADKWWEKRKYQLGDYKLIRYQILQTNLTRTVWQIVRRITNEILGVEGLVVHSYLEGAFIKVTFADMSMIPSAKAIFDDDDDHYTGYIWIRIIPRRYKYLHFSFDQRK